MSDLNDLRVPEERRVVFHKGFKSLIIDLDLVTGQQVFVVYLDLVISQQAGVGFESKSGFLS